MSFDITPPKSFLSIMIIIRTGLARTEVCEASAPLLWGPLSETLEGFVRDGFHSVVVIPARCSKVLLFRRSAISMVWFLTLG